MIKVHTKNVHIGPQDSSNSYFNCISFGKNADTNNPYGWWAIEANNNNDSNKLRFYRSNKTGLCLTLDYLTENVGIGTFYPTAKLHVDGVVKCTSVETSSDEKIKSNIKSLESALENVLKLHSVTYKWKTNSNLTDEEILKIENIANDTTEAYKQKVIDDFREKERLKAGQDTTLQIGFLAQELRKIFPNLVSEDSKGMLYMNYLGLIPVLAKAIQELQVQINDLKESIPPSTGSITDQSTDKAQLYQNSPNPFSENTEIKFYIPHSARNAILNIYDLTGLQLKQISLVNKGEASIIIKGKEFNAGMYLYSLLIDGVEIDTKKMILTK